MMNDESNNRFQFKNWMQGNEFLALLLALGAFLFLPSFFIGETIKDVLIYSFLVVLLVAGVYELREKKTTLLTGVVLAGLALLLNSLPVSKSEDTLFLLRLPSLILFFLLLTAHVLYRMAISRSINLNTIFGAVSGYLLLGLMGGLAFRLVHHFYENSFVFVNGLEPKVDDFTYLSFVTLATLGYGDITPLSPPAKALSIFLSVSGQMYLVVVIGVIVGKFSVSRKSS